MVHRELVADGQHRQVSGQKHGMRRSIDVGHDVAGVHNSIGVV